MKAVWTVAALTSALLSCSRTPPPVVPGPAGVAQEPGSSPPNLSDKSPSRAVIHVSEDIRRACGITDTEAHFAFDSAAVRSIDYPTLDKMVRCFSSGPLAKRHMRLVGHADPRGSDEYNLVLGGSRADGVRIFLLNRGLRGQQMATTSRGEMDAKGTDEASWVADRRVDILLAN